MSACNICAQGQHSIHIRGRYRS